MTELLQVDQDAGLAILLEAVAAEAQPLLAAGRTGRIVINFSGGNKVRIETARFRDVNMSAAAQAVAKQPARSEAALRCERIP